jgi:hypothetical protein
MLTLISCSDFFSLIKATLLVNVDENTNDYGSIRENNNNQ